MKKALLLSIVLTLISISCQKRFSGIEKNEWNSVFEIQTKSIDESTFYDEQSGFFLAPMKDLYELSNVQQTYEKLTGEKKPLLPTHKALKIMPKDEFTAHRLLSDTTMWVSRIPFGWRPVAQKIDPTVIDSELFYDNDSSDVLDGGGSPSELTPIYARWPVEKRIPDNLSYEFLYDIYSPSGYSKTDSLLTSALSSNPTIRIERPDGGHQPTWHLRIKAFDNVLNSYQVMRNVHVRYRNYSNYYSCTLSTNAFGMVEVPADATMTCVVMLDLYTDEFKVSSDNNSNHVSLLLHSLYTYADMPFSTFMGYPTTTVELSYLFKIQVFQSASYYFYGQNDLLNNIEKMELDTPLRIAAYADSASLTHNGISGIGWFFGGSNPPYIEIANYSNSSSKILGTTLHELGHASHYSEMGASFFSTHSRIKESFASLMGWYNVKKYYSTVLTTDSQVHAACTQGRQLWNGSVSDSYTPIYIDFIDDYNQRKGSSFVNDLISGISIENVLSFAIGPTTWAQSRYLMQQQAGVLYSSSSFNSLISLYPLN